MISSKVRKVHTMPEALISQPSSQAWGCTPTPGWVPYPKQIPRRHPLVDAVGRIDDPCDRPVYTDGKAIPAFKAPQEGFPHDVCRIEDYKKTGEQSDADLPEGAAVINIARDTPKAIQLRIPAIYMDQTDPAESPSTDRCCEESRSLDATRKKYCAMLPPSQDWTQDGSCSPTNPGYLCTGVIGEIMRDPTPLFVSEQDKCLPLSLRSGQGKPGDWRDMKPLTGWEYINGERTCDLYPIAENLPSRFNNPKWFKGYGCERPAHPFYVTTTADYGRFSPNPHTMTQKFFPRSGAFSKLMSAGGMYRNRTLNTSNTKSVV